MVLVVTVLTVLTMLMLVLMVILFLGLIVSLLHAELVVDLAVSVLL